MDAAEFKQQFLPYHRKLYRTAFRLTENPQEAEGCPVEFAVVRQELLFKLSGVHASSLFPDLLICLYLPL